MFIKTTTIRHGAIVAMAMIASLLFLSCNDDKSNFDKVKNSRDSLAVLSADSVTTLISDSGVTRFRISTQKWLVFDKTKEPHWLFPKGIKFEKFDSTYKVDASMTADSAIYHQSNDVWEFNRNVTAQNQDGDKFKTQQLFWDNRGERFYSDQKIRIEQKDKIIEGIGFESNSKMTKYEIKHPTGIFPVDE